MSTETSDTPSKVPLWRNPFGPLMMLPFLLVWLIAIFAPLNILDLCPSCDSLSNSVRRAITDLAPFVDIQAFARSTTFPQVAFFVSALYWALLPVMGFLHLVSLHIGIRESRWMQWKIVRSGYPEVFLIDFIKAAGGLLLFTFSAYAATALPGGWSLFGGFGTTNRLVLVIIFGPIFFMIALHIGVIYALIRALVHFNILNRE